ncbi:phage head-tail joining protein [Falsigemmobacter faecalis]|uniref:Uncharacterized protein n=1 Tax=Falsigemmobacter faecalis TaxID=2488730 RepID=A0A3P3DCB5_9RHOB|nr:hypothetical protein [Falsigemmobacter faecalis]RRH71977.1 hypothetical protein EG244_15805 [Falsigemmobacter faecalis]
MSIPTADMIALRDKLILERARGVRSLQMGEEKVEYRSDTEMAAAIADLEMRINRASSHRPATVRFSSSKGL